MLLSAEAAARILGAVARAVTVYDRGPVAVLEVLLAVGTRFDDQGWLGHEGSFHLLIYHQPVTVCGAPGRPRSR